MTRRAEAEAPPVVERVAQEHPKGCGVACLAMLMGCTYAEAVEAIERVHPADGYVQRSLDAGGTTYVELTHVLAWSGYATAIRWRGPKNHRREPWPPAPFAPLHLVSVTLPTGGHFVVWDGTRVLDPFTDEPRTLDDYENVELVAGVVKIAGGPDADA